MVVVVTYLPVLRALVDPPSLRAQVGQQLRDALVAGELVAGVVYSAPTLGAKLGVSATPVREAMLDLVRDGLVETLRNKGFRIVALSPKRLAELLAVRADLESAALARVAAAPRTDLAELEVLLTDMAAAGSRGDEPPSIVLYRKNLARAVRTRAELSEQIRDTLLHGIGHLEGLDEDDLRRRGME